MKSFWKESELQYRSTGLFLFPFKKKKKSLLCALGHVAWRFREDHWWDQPLAYLCSSHHFQNGAEMKLDYSELCLSQNRFFFFRYHEQIHCSSSFSFSSSTEEHLGPLPTPTQVPQSHPPLLWERNQPDDFPRHNEQSLL